MPNFHEIQMLLDKVLGPTPAGNHGAFWRGKTRDEFVELAVFGIKIIEPGAPEKSPLIGAMRGSTPYGSERSQKSNDQMWLCLAAEQPAATKEDIEFVSNWIAQGCPDEHPTAEVRALAIVENVDDETHVKYWRSIDFFFLPSLASPETRDHVLRLHMDAFGPWKASNILDQGADAWNNYMNRADVQESFRHVRFHQTRIIEDFYGTSQDNLLDSLWKFGGDLLPPDPQIGIPPKRTMNSPYDWFWWIPYLEMSLRAGDATESDIRLARAWQVGIIADGLVRGRLDIPEFQATDPSLEQNVKAAFENTQPDELVQGMVARGVRFAKDPGFPPFLFPDWPQP